MSSNFKRRGHSFYKNFEALATVVVPVEGQGLRGRHSTPEGWVPWNEAGIIRPWGP